MADKSHGSQGAGAAPAVADPAAVRNVVLVGPVRRRQNNPGGRPAGGRRRAVPARLIADGTTVCDYDDAEIRQQRSVSLALASLAHDGVKVNLVDTPGYADFVGELRAGLRAADCALFVIAANEGVDEPTKSLWQECSQVGDAPGSGDNQARPRTGELRRARWPRRRTRSATRCYLSICRQATG